MAIFDYNKYIEVRADRQFKPPLEVTFFVAALTQGLFSHEVRAMNTLPLKADDVRKEFIYSDGFLFRRKTGLKAGNKDARYARVRLNGKSYLQHRVIWAIENGDLHGNTVIDHIDGNTFNNKIENLRATTQRENSLHRTNKNKNNTSGFRGINWHKGHRRWTVRKNINGTRVVIGEYKEINDAIKAYKECYE